MKKVTFLLSVLLTFVVNIALAQQVSVNEALSRASSFLQSHPSAHRAPANGKDAAASRQLTLAYTGHHLSKQKACFYVFNRGTDNGFIIMGGDEAAKEVLGYSTTGSFDYDHAPANFLWWLSQYQQDISSAIDYVELHPEALNKTVQNATAEGKRKTAAAVRQSVGPLVTTKWNQDAPYYNAINADFNVATGYTGNYGLVTGCVATAMAQVMKFHEWPVRGTGQHTDANNVNYGTKVFTPSANFGATTYDWDNMLDEYDNNATAAQNNAVATLMYHCGVSVDMSYSNSASGALSQKLPGALATYFGYDKSVRSEVRDVFTDGAWEDLVYAELAANRPVLYGGQSTSGGHQFVCDGYDAANGFYSFNWGWGGYADGYYALTGKYALQPNGSGIGGAGTGAAYTGSQIITTNVMREQGGKERVHLAQIELTRYGYPNVLYLQDASTIYDQTYTHQHSNSSIYLYLASSMQSLCSTITNVVTGVKATNRNTGKVTYFDGRDFQNFKAGTYYSQPIPNSFNVNSLTDNGIYEIRPVVRPADSNSDWEDIDILATETAPTIIVTGANAVAPLNLSFSVANNELSIDHTMQITTDNTYSGHVTYTSSNESVATVDGNGLITAVGKGSATITVKADDMVVNGTTLYSGTEQQIDIEVTQAVKKVPTVSISATVLTVGGTATVTVENYEGTFTLSSSNSNIASVSGNTITGVRTGTATITVTAPETASDMAINETFVVNVTNNSVYMMSEPYFSNDNNPYCDDMTMNFCIKNNTNLTKETWLYMMLYSVSTNNAEKLLDGKGIGWNLPSGYVLNGSDDIKSRFNGTSFVVNQKYRLKFYSAGWGTSPWNIPSIDFVYRDRLDYSYTLTDAGVGTLILPFNATLPVSLKAYECIGVEGGTLYLAEATSLKRNVPYIITGAPQTVTFAGPKAIDELPLLFGDHELKGTFHDTYKFRAGDYILQKQNDNVAFYRYTTGDWSATPFRAFVQLAPGTTSKYAAIAIPEPDDDNVITDILPSAFNIQKPAGIYSVDGTKRSELRHGLNIIVDEQGNTRKVFVK